MIFDHKNRAYRLICANCEYTWLECCATGDTIQLSNSLIADSGFSNQGAQAPEIESGWPIERVAQ
jgi:hypothetical protein